MSQDDFQKARKRLERAKKEVSWAIAVLEDPAAHLKQYHLSQDEEEELFQELHTDLTEIQTSIAQLFSRKRQIKIDNKTVKMVGPIPPWLTRIETVGSISIESVGPIPPWSEAAQILGEGEIKSSRSKRRAGEIKSSRSRPRAGEIEPGENATSVGPIKPYNPGSE